MSYFRDIRLGEALTEWQRCRDEGHPFDPAEWLNRYADVADALRALIDAGIVTLDRLPPETTG